MKNLRWTILLEGCLYLKILLCLDDYHLAIVVQNKHSPIRRPASSKMIVLYMWSRFPQQVRSPPCQIFVYINGGLSSIIVLGLEGLLVWKHPVTSAIGGKLNQDWSRSSFLPWAGTMNTINFISSDGRLQLHSFVK